MNAYTADSNKGRSIKRDIERQNGGANRKGLCSLQSRIEIPLAAHFGNERNFSLFSSNLNLLKLFNDREMAKTLVSRHASRAPVTPSVMKLVGIAGAHC